MNTGQTVFAQLLDLIPTYEFRKCVHRYHGNRGVKHFTCWDQFLCMLYAQLTGRESLRSLEVCLHSVRTHLYHCGIRSPMSRSNLAHANEQRDWRIYADFAQVLIQQAVRLYGEREYLPGLQQAVYAFDSTTIELCRALFPWARFGRQAAGVKLHTLLDLRTDLPTFACITPRRIHDVQLLDRLPWQPGAIYVLDRGYLDFARLYRIHRAAAFFIIRARRDLRYYRHDSVKVNKATGLRADQTVSLVSYYPRHTYLEPLRRISFRDPVTGNGLVFLTNHTTLPALTITELYRGRWRVELFFKWIKSHLRIKAFYGTSANAVQTQLWIAICAYVLVAIARHVLQVNRSHYTILHILEVTLTEKRPLYQVLTESADLMPPRGTANQKNLFEIF